MKNFIYYFKIFLLIGSCIIPFFGVCIEDWIIKGIFVCGTYALWLTAICFFLYKNGFGLFKR